MSQQLDAIDEKDDFSVTEKEAEAIKKRVKQLDEAVDDLRDAARHLYDRSYHFESIDIDYDR